MPIFWKDEEWGWTDEEWAAHYAKKVVVPMELFERLVTGAELLSEGRRTGEEARAAWEKIVAQAKSLKIEEA